MPRKPIIMGEDDEFFGETCGICGRQATVKVRSERRNAYRQFCEMHFGAWLAYEHDDDKYGIVVWGPSADLIDTVLYGPLPEPEEG